MLMTYGRGRAEQLRVHPTFGSLLNLIPAIFCAYLVVLLVLESAAPGTPLACWGAAPLALYALAIVLQTAASVFASGLGRSLAAIPLLALSHILYGVGFWRGLFTNLDSGRSRARAEVRLEKVDQ
jgi:hypothetical protein